MAKCPTCGLDHGKWANCQEALGALRAEQHTLTETQKAKVRPVEPHNLLAKLKRYFQ